MNTEFKTSRVTYKVLERLGEGLHSTVYKAERSDQFHHLRQVVALKVLKSKNSIKLWKDEFASLEKLNCRHCVRVFGFEWLGGRPALVLEYVRGVSLRQLCLSGPVATEGAKEILAQIQLGLASLRDNGISHGDLSPNNVMIDSAGWVKLLDFGWGNGRDHSRHATLPFAAPELLFGSKPTYLSDLFSLGALEQMLLQIKTGRLSGAPSDRTPFPEPPCDRRRKELGAKVLSLLENQKRFRHMATRSILAHHCTKRLHPLFFLASLIMLFAPLPAPPSSNDSLLRIRSLRWLRISINGQTIGFAPQDVLVRSGKPLRLIWQSSRGRGEIFFQLNTGESKTLNDADFVL